MNMSVKMDEKSMQSFPVGMHVLAVDDDPLCLLLVEKLLRRCHYQVTTCGQAIMALTLLRENKEKFDLVISDVYMPDMDGFKLLELVELEMDLPVIMMSAFDEKSSVMKGITHGACDYLLKPIRIQELKNIWQHVVRRKWNETKDRDHSGAGDENDKPIRGTEDGEFGSSANCGMVGTFYKKRKEQKDDNADEIGHRNNDASTLKKQRFVWTPDLHQKFVSAVDKLGIDRAVPKRIMDLMNVQGLSRENVASHLQKYRLYLKKFSVAGNHPVDLGSAFAGGKELSFACLGSVNGFGDLQKLATSGQLPSQFLAALRTGIGGSLNSLGGLGIVGPESSGMFQLEALQDSTNSIIGRAHRTPYPLNNQCNLFPSLPSGLELEQIYQKQQISRFRGVEATMSEPVLHSSQYLLTAGNGLNNLDSAGSDKGNLTIEMANNTMLPQLLHQQQQQQQQCRGLVSLPMAGIVDQHPRPRDPSGLCASGPNDSCGISVHLSNTNGFRRNWSGAAVSGFPPSAWKSCTPLCDKDSSGQDLLESLLRDSNVDRESMDILVANCGGSTVTVPMSVPVSTPSFTEVSGPAYNPVTREDLSLSNVSAIGANMGVATDCASSDNSSFKFPIQGSLNIEHQQGMNQGSKEGWHGQREALGHISNPSLNLVSAVNQELTYGAQAQRQNTVYGGQQMNSAFKPLADADVALSSRQCTMERSTAGKQLKSREDHPVEPMRVENPFLSENSISIDDLMDSPETTTERHWLYRWWHGM